MRPVTIESGAENWAIIREVQRIAPKVIDNCYVTTTFVM